MPKRENTNFKRKSMGQENMKNQEREEEKHQSNQQSPYIQLRSTPQCGTEEERGIHTRAGAPAQKMNLAALWPITSL